MVVIHTLVWALIFSVTPHASAQSNHEGDDCQLSSGAAGVCVVIGQCPSANAQIAQRPPIFPKICSFKGHTAIVCCVKTPFSPPTRLKLTTILTTPRATTPRPTTPRHTTPRPTTARPTTTRKAVRLTPKPILQKMGKSWEKCVHYSSAVLQEAHSPILNFGDTKVLVPDCAQSIQQLIVNGEKTLPKEFPHMVALGFGDYNRVEWACGGSLISERFVLTAAHCLSRRGWGNVRWARVGDLNLVEKTEESRPQTLLVIERIPHSGYRPPALYNDIALLRLNASVQFNAFVRPACLHTNRTTSEGDIATATGWGATEQGRSSDVLLKADLRFVNPTSCNNSYQSLTTSKKLLNGYEDDSMICAGGNQTDTCVGDSGGPLQVRLSDPYCMYSIVGLTSFSRSAACVVTLTPAVYTRVSHFVPWIESIVWRWSN